jgi:hypothetical protein
MRIIEIVETIDVFVLLVFKTTFFLELHNCIIEFMVGVKVLR